MLISPQAPTFAFCEKPAHLDAILYRQRAAGIKAHEGGESHVQHVLPQRKGLGKHVDDGWTKRHGGYKQNQWRKLLLEINITSNVKIYVKYNIIYGTGGATASFWNKKLPSTATGHLRLLGSLGNPLKRQRTIGILRKLE